MQIRPGHYSRHHIPTGAEIDEALRLAERLCPPRPHKRRFFDTPDGLTLDQIGLEEGCSKQRVAMIEKRAMERLLVYATARLGQLPRDLDDLCAAFSRPVTEREAARLWRDRERILSGAGTGRVVACLLTVRLQTRPS